MKSFLPFQRDKTFWGDMQPKIHPRHMGALHRMAAKIKKKKIEKKKLYILFKKNFC